MDALPTVQPDESRLRIAFADVAQLLADAGLDPSAGFQAVPAEVILRRHHPGVEVSLPLLITGITDADAASAVAGTLRNAYPEDHLVILVDAKNWTPIAQVELAAMSEPTLPDPPIMLLVPPLAPGSSFTDLQEIVAHLRAPDGCPWDREQNLASLRQDLLSEAVEVLEAIDLEQAGIDNSQHIAEELGDTMMLATLLTQIAIDEGRFRMADVMRHIVEKLIRRHPHVFGDVEVDGNDDIVANWDAIKAEEKASKGMAAHGPLDGIPAHLPALEKARRLQSKASKAGLLDRAALAGSQPGLAALVGEVGSEGAGGEERALGELLWTLVAIAYERGINAEDALRSYAVAYREANGA